MDMNRVVVNGLVYRRDCGILFNPQTNVVLKLNETALEIVESAAGGLSTEQTAEAIARKYNVDSQEVKEDILTFWEEASCDSDESGELELEKDMSNLPDFPLSLELALTNACNLDCVFCYDAVLNGGKRSFFPLESVKTILTESANAGLLRVRYSGGEPTLHPDFHEILALGKALGLYQVVFTNGQLLDERVLGFWKDMNVQEVLISLHGLGTNHDQLTGRNGSYEKAIKAIRAVLAAKIDLIVEMTLTRQNLTEVFDILDVIRALGVKEVRLMRYVARGKDDEAYSITQPELFSVIDRIDQGYHKGDLSIQFPCSQRFCLSEDNDPIDANVLLARKKYLTKNCFAGLNWASVSHDGKLRICPHFKKSQADLLHSTRPLIEIWSQVSDPVKKMLTRRVDACGHCSAWGDCLGGCYLSEMDNE